MKTLYRCTLKFSGVFSVSLEHSYVFWSLYKGNCSLGLMAYFEITTEFISKAYVDIWLKGLTRYEVSKSIKQLQHLAEQNNGSMVANDTMCLD